MESLFNYNSDDENDVPPSSHVNAAEDLTRCGMEGDNYDDVQMDMSENPLNGSKAPSVQAHSPGWSGGAPPTCATNQLDSNSESAGKDEGNCSAHNSENDSGSSSSSPASAASSKDSESDEDEKSKLDESVPQNSASISDKLDNDKIGNESGKAQDQIKRDHDNRRDHDRERDRNRDRERDRERNRGSDDREKREDFRRDDRHRSRSRDRKERHRSPDKSEKRRSRERDEHRKSRDRRSSSRERSKRRDLDRRLTESRGRDYDRKRHRSRSRSAEKHRPGNDSRSSSSSGGSRNDARCRDTRVPPSGPSRGSRSRSKSVERERSRGLGDSRKFYLEKKIDRKLNVLERMGIELKAEPKTSAGTVTPQMLVQRTMEQEAAQVKRATGVELPSYYNAAAVNPQRLVDQIQKRKLLWGARKDDSSKATVQPQGLNKWQGATFAQDQDGKLTAKFNRLMGIKQATQVAPDTSGETASGSEIIKKQEEMFHNMESQYEVARLATHTHRGLGLGFGTFQPR